MAHDLVSCIENLDDTFESGLLIEGIYRFIVDKIGNPLCEHEISDIVFDMYARLCREGGLIKSTIWWEQNFSSYKIIRQELEDHNIEPQMNYQERLFNLYVIDGILFYIKLMILSIHLQSETENTEEP